MQMATGGAPVFRWVNHAGFIFDYDGVRLMSDPWMDGAAFNNGWALLSDTRFRYDDFDTITHIWFSHEHPDHFSPPNLRRIPEQARARITILFQQTLDRKVIQYCEGLGFGRVVELEPNSWVDLSQRLRVLCCPYTDDDSWIALRTPEGTILNLNDCVVDTHAKARAIRNLVGPVRVLMTQFSYAQWAGNSDDRAAQAAEAREKLGRVKIQASVFEPVNIIPFASFMWFCHEENFGLNDEMNDAARAADFITTQTRAEPVVLYPGDCWTLGEAHDWRPAARAYADDYQRRMTGGPVERTRQVPWSEIEAAFEPFLKRIRNKNNPLLQLIPVPSTTVRVSDAGVTVKLTLRGLRRIADPPGGADITMNAENLLYCLRFDWGSNTLHANGRFIETRKGRHTRFFRFFRIADDNNHGKVVSPHWLATKIVARGRRALSRAWQAVH